MWLTSYMPGLAGYFAANAFVLVSCVAGCALLLAKLRPPVAVARFALAPALITYAVLNWDALALVALVAAFVLLTAERPGWAGVALGLGAAAKLFPMFAVPVMLAACLRADRRGRRSRSLWSPPPQRSLRLAAGFGIVSAALNLPFAMANFRGWFLPYAYQASRAPNVDSFWAGLPALPTIVPSAVFAGGLILGTLWLALCVYRNGNWAEGVALVLLLFLLLTKVYSPQYDLWLLPLLAVLLCPLWLWGVFVVADLVYYVSIFALIAIQTGATFLPIDGHPEALLRAAVWGRELTLAGLFIWVARRFVSARVAEPRATDISTAARWRGL